MPLVLYEWCFLLYWETFCSKLLSLAQSFRYEGERILLLTYGPMALKKIEISFHSWTFAFAGSGPQTDETDHRPSY